MERIITSAMNALMVLLGLTLLAMVGLSVWNVVARYVFSSALLWADEVAVFAMIILTWLGAIVVAWRSAEISMGLLVAMLPRGLQKPIRIFQYLVTAVACGWVAWLSWNYVERLFQFGMTSDAARIPVWIVHGAITLSLACMSLIAIWRIAGQLMPLRADAPQSLTIEKTSS